MGTKIEKHIIEKEEKKIVEAWCDFCGEKFDDVFIQSEGFGHIGISFGYGSSFDDDYFGLQICDNCFIKKFGNKLIKQFKEKGYDINMIKEIIKSSHSCPLLRRREPNDKRFF